MLILTQCKLHFAKVSLETSLSTYSLVYGQFHFSWICHLYYFFRIERSFHIDSKQVQVFIPTLKILHICLVISISFILLINPSNSVLPYLVILISHRHSTSASLLLLNQFCLWELGVSLDRF